MVSKLSKTTKSIILLFSQIGGLPNYPAANAVELLLQKTDGYVFGICHLVDVNGHEKPSYFAVQEAIASYRARTAS